jgi:hypothetical protein
MIEEEIRRARKLLDTLITISGLHRRQVDARLGAGHGQASQILTGRVELKYRHILSFLAAMDVDPGLFFRVLYPEPPPASAPARPPGPGGRLAGPLFRQPQTSGFRGLRPSPAPAAPVPDAAELERRIREAIRAVLGAPDCED